jgi:hypothetical protein
MDKRSARRDFISEWMLEFSVLWAVFPMLDLMLTGRLQAWILAIGWTLTLLSFLLGLFLRSQEE